MILVINFRFMSNLLFFLIIIFVAIHIIQLWVMFNYKHLMKGAVIIGAMEVLEWPLVIYSILKGETIAFLVIILVEVVFHLIIPIKVGQ